MPRETLLPEPLDGCDPVVGEALWRLQDSRDRTLRLLRDIPADLVDRPTNGNTIGTILYHMALIEADWLFVEILEEQVSPDVAALLPVDDRDEQGILTAVKDESLEQHRDRLAKIRAVFLDRTAGMSAEDFSRARELPSYTVSPAWVIHHLTQHEAEHRGELGLAADLMKS